jgi:murein DD-endopeptidase MepM/ murein hydrolase activator NlpD/uncharacterized protein YgiM (DUF1202 family)
LLLFGSTPPVFADTDLTSGDKAVIANTGGDVILLRADAGYQFSVLEHLTASTSVTVLDGPVEGDDGNLWYRIDASGTTGYVFATFLVSADRAPAALANEPATAESRVVETKAVVGTGGDGLHLRDGADVSAAILAVLPEGAAVTITGAPRLNGGQAWYPVAYDGVNGWAAADYLGAATSGASAPATNRQALALTIGEHVEVSNTGGWPVRLRAAGNLDAPTLDAAPEGAVLRVLDGPLTDASGNAWYAVDYDGVTGYASAAYLSWTDAALSERQVAAPAATAAGSGIATGGNAEVGNTGGWPLRVRADSALDAATLAVAPEGTVVTILDGPIVDGAGNAWYAVEYAGVQGFAGANYLSATDRAATERQPGASVGAPAASGFAVGSNVAVSNTGGWNLRLREEAGLNGGVVIAADEGTVLVVISGPVTDGEGNAWYGLDYDGVQGFARASYLNATDRPASARIAPPAPSAPEVAAATAPAADPAPAAPAPAAPVPAPAAPAPQPASQPAPQPQPAAQPRATGSFIWPAQGRLTQSYGGNAGFYGPGGHNGIDIANSVGTPIVAADGGVVTYAGWKGGLGNAVVIDHGNGFVTEYGHGSAIHVRVGQRVERGAKIMSMGSTGNSTGSHLHFSVILNGVYRNPMEYLPR